MSSYVADRYSNNYIVENIIRKVCFIKALKNIKNNID